MLENKHPQFLGKPKKREDEDYTSKKFQKHNHILLPWFSASIIM